MAVRNNDESPNRRMNLFSEFNSQGECGNVRIGGDISSLWFRPENFKHLLQLIVTREQLYNGHSRRTLPGLNSLEGWTWYPNGCG
jgi:hypothetical protein